MTDGSVRGWSHVPGARAVESPKTSSAWPPSGRFFAVGAARLRPATQGIGSTGRDHHPKAFTCCLAGAGAKRSFAYGASDEIGYFTAEKEVTIPDFHATILHLLGIDHEKLTFYHNGINRRLTDVHGHVLDGILA